MKKRNVFVLMCLVVVLAVSLTLVACDNTKEYTVTFKGTNVETFTQTVENGKTATEPTAPTRTGYDFKGWLLNGQIYDFTTPVKQDIELTAVWDGKTYTVTLNPGQGNSVETETKQVKFGETFDFGKATSSDETLLFGGWKYNDNPITNENGVGNTAWNMTEDIQVTAIWIDRDEKAFSFTELEDGTYLVMAVQGFDYSIYGDIVEIPSSYNEKAVTKIGSMSNFTASAVKIPSSITEITASAFANNYYVGVVDMSEFSGKIGEKAFMNSNVRIIDLGNTTEIGASAFKNAKTKIISVPATVKSIGDEALLSKEIIEVGFMGAIPALGQNVFGDGRRDGDVKFSIIALQSAWEQLVADAESEDFKTAVTEKTGIESGSIYQFTDADMQESIMQEGIFDVTGETVLAYRGLMLTAVLYDYVSDIDNSDWYDMYEVSHLYKYKADGKDRDTYVFDYDNRTLFKVQRNAKGEVIYNNVLYDYLGTDLVYIVPDEITKIAGGAAMANASMRFVDMGDNVTAIGDFAFAMTTLFGISIGKNVAAIGDYAFFGQDYLQQIIFEGTTAPAIGTAAFCTMVGTGGIGPSLLCTESSAYAGGYVYTPLSASGWWSDPDCQPFIDALNENLSKLGDLLPTVDGKPAAYSSNEFKQLEKSYFYKVGQQYETPYGTITMLGTEREAYAYVEFNEECRFSGIGYVYYSSMKLPGYSQYDDSDPKKLEFISLTETGFDSFIINGRFTDGQFVMRGSEAGSFGEVGHDIFTFDGFGKFSYFAADGATVEGDYTVNGSEISFGSALSGTATLDTTAGTLTYDNQTLTALGEGAGVYYDLGNAAKLTMDGKAYTENDVKYDGKATIEYKGETTTVGYVFSGSTEIKVTFKGAERSWSYSKTSSSYVVQFYYDPDSYGEQLSFAVVENTLRDTFTNGADSISFDGYFNATVVTGADEKVGTYVRFNDSNSYMINVEGETTIIYVDFDNKTYTVATAEESGKWFASGSANYAWYFDGNGNYMYYNGSYVHGTYEYDSASGTMDIVYGGNPTVDGVKSNINIADGIGVIVFNSYGNNYSAISRQPFMQFTNAYGSKSNYIAAYSFVAGLNAEPKIITVSPYFNIYVTGNTVFANTYGKPFAITSFIGALKDATFEFEFEVDANITATFSVTVTEKDGVYSAQIAPVHYYSAESTVKSADGNTTYNVSWIDQTHVVIWSVGSWGGGEELASGTVAGGASESFTVGEYQISGYGTENATVTKITTPAA